MISTNPQFTKFRGIDLYCGAGGMSTGAEQSGHVRIDLAVNHWRPAIMTHSANHPHTRHICAEMEHVDPENDPTLPAADLIMAGVECTHHSNAKGDAPVSDQKRSSANDVLRWLKAKLPKYFIIENVREFRDWCRTRLKRNKNGKKVWDKKHEQFAREADPRYKGEYFIAWLEAATALGYYIEYRLLNSADYGEATKRIRLFIIGRLGGGPIAWPEPTHAEVANGKPQWRGAWEIIDWKKPAPSVFGRQRPLAEKTIARIKIGLCKFNAPKTVSDGMEAMGVAPFIVKAYGTNNVAAIDSPLPTVTATGNHLWLAEPFIVKYHSGQQAKHWQNGGASIFDPLPTIDTNPRFAVARPFVFNHDHRSGNGSPHFVADPLTTVTSKQRHCFVQPFICRIAGPGSQRLETTLDSIHDPLRTILTREDRALAVPFVYQLIGRGAGRSYDVGRPLPTIVSARENFGVVQPFLVPKFNERKGQLPRTHSIYDPLPTVTSFGGGQLAIPFLVDPNWQDNRGGRNRVHSIHNPLGTITTCNQKHVAIPFLLPRQGYFDSRKLKRCRSIQEPLNTITGSHVPAHLVQPFIVNYYGTGVADSTDEPLSTVTTKHRHGLTLFGDGDRADKLIILNEHEARLFYAMRLFGFDDILFRMLDVDELAKAMGLPDNYFLYGNKAEQIKQVGNAVSVRTMKAICLAIGEHEIELAEAA